jgi:hypothetical protein
MLALLATTFTLAMPPPVLVVGDSLAVGLEP